MDKKSTSSTSVWGAFGAFLLVAVLGTFVSAFLKVIANEAPFALYTPTAIAALVFAALARYKKFETTWLRIAVATQVGWLAWIALSYTLTPRSTVLLDVIVLGGGLVWVAISSRLWPIALLLTYNVVALLANIRAFNASTSRTMEAILLVSIAFHLVPVFAMLAHLFLLRRKPAADSGDVTQETPLSNRLKIDSSADSAMADPPSQVNKATGEQQSSAARLREVKKLFDDGLITEEEYARKRQSIIDET